MQKRTEASCCQREKGCKLRPLDQRMHFHGVGSLTPLNGALAEDEGSTPGDDLRPGYRGSPQWAMQGTATELARALRRA